MSPGLRSGGNKLDDGSHGEITSSISSSESSDSGEEDDSVLIDVLASAISHVRISEPKRSRLCGPTGPMDQQGSSNMNANNLCKAF